MSAQQHHHHEEEHFTGSAMVRDIVIGMSDGLTVPFALAAGLSGAVADSHNGNWLIITAGVAEIIAGSIAMGLGGYLAGKTDYDHYQSELKREYEETHTKPEAEKREIREILAEYNISEATQNAVVEELSQNRDKWVEFMMKFELGLEEPHPHEAARSAGFIASSYIAGGLIPLFPYLITDTPLDGLYLSMLVTLLALFVFGYFKSKVTGQNVWSGALRTMAIGAVAAAAAFFIAKAIGGEKI